ncbi:MAG: hypothetical protein ACTHQ3_20890 [Motilibacteraceae bacterium]
MFVLCTCPLCGDVRLPAGEVVLTEYANLSSSSTYVFTCPGCGEQVRKPAERWVLEALAKVPVQRTVVRVPAEAFELHSGAAINDDDVLDFARALAEIDDLASIADTRSVPVGDRTALRRTPSSSLAEGDPERRPSAEPAAEQVRRRPRWLARLLRLLDPFA